MSKLKFNTTLWVLLAGCASKAPEAEGTSPALGSSEVVYIDTLFEHALEASAAPQTFQAGPGPTDFQVHFIDVGTGDCIWIHTGDDGIPGNGKLEGFNIIIDGGDAPSFGRVDGYQAASQYLTEDDKLPKGSTIDWLVATHPHSDHCGGLDNFLDDYDVLNILDPGHDPVNEDGVPASQRPGSVYGKFFGRASTEMVDGVKSDFLWGLPDDLMLDWGDELNVEVLHSSTEIIDNDLNNTSIVLALSFTDASGGPSFLFTGDAEKAVETSLATELGPELQTDVLKAGHHGSKSSSTKLFLEGKR